MEVRRPAPGSGIGRSAAVTMRRCHSTPHRIAIDAGWAWPGGGRLSASPSLGNVDGVGLSTQPPPHNVYDTPMNPGLILKDTAPVAAFAGFVSSVSLCGRAEHHALRGLNGTDAGVWVPSVLTLRGLILADSTEWE